MFRRREKSTSLYRSATTTTGNGRNGGSSARKCTCSASLFPSISFTLGTLACQSASQPANQPTSLGRPKAHALHRLCSSRDSFAHPRPGSGKSILGRTIAQFWQTNRTAFWAPPTHSSVRGQGRQCSGCVAVSKQNGTIYYEYI